MANRKPIVTEVEPLIKHESAELEFLSWRTERLQFLSISKVCELTNLSKPTLWRLRRSPASRFPHPISLSPGRVVFSRAEIEEWLRGRMAEGRV